MTYMKQLRATSLASSTSSLLPKWLTLKHHPHNTPTLQDVDAQMVKTGFDMKTCHANHMLEALIQKGELSLARKMFDDMLLKNTVTVNKMISGYAKSGNLQEAQHLFDNTTERSNVTWTIMIGGYSQLNRTREAFMAFREMMRSGCKLDHVTLVTLLSACNDVEASDGVVLVHTQAVKLGYESTLLVCNTLVDSYCKCCLLDAARRLFDEIPEKDRVTFNAMVMGYSKDGFYGQALDLFQEMQTLGLKPSQFTFSGVLCAATGLGDLALGQQVHCFVIKTNFGWNVFVNNSLLDFYSKTHSMSEASKLFLEMPERDNVSYNVMVSGFAWDGQREESLELFREMQVLDFDQQQLPYASILSVAATLPDFEMGRQIHTLAIITNAESDILVSNSLVDMYAKCGELETAEMIFTNRADRNTVSWTAMISGYIQNGLYEEALKLFCKMRRVELNPDRATFSSILRASASLASLGLGKQLHSYIIRSGHMFSVFAGSALLDMYAKCGCLEDTFQTFQEMPDRNIVSWNAMISAYAQNGRGKAAVSSFEEMIQQGVEPDSVSFLSVLSACSHSGLVEEGLQYFDYMTEIYRIKPKKEHYSCVIDILGRVGRLDEAQNLVSQMPFEADQVIWSSIFNSCRIHRNQELARRAADKLFNMELKDAAPYVIMSNIYAARGRWEDVA